MIQSNLPSDFRIQLEKEINSFINFLYRNYDFKNFDYWYFQLDELVSIFQFEHLKKINKYFMENPQSENVGEYLDFVSRHFDDIIEESIDVVRKIAEETHAEILGEYGCVGFDTFGPLKLIGGMRKGHPNAEEVRGAVKFYQGIVNAQGEPEKD